MQEMQAVELPERGGARLVLATAPSGRSISELVNALGPPGEIVVVSGSADPMAIASTQLLNGCRTIRGWTAGQAKDSENTIRFSIQTGIRPIVEPFRLPQFDQAFQRMMEAKGRFRAVLAMD